MKIVSDFQPHQPENIKRPTSVTVLILGVLTIAVLNLLRFIYVIREYQFLDDLLPFSPGILIIISIVWGISFAVSAWGLFSRYRWASILTRWLSVIYLVFYWLDRMLFYNETVQASNALFLIGLSVITIGYVFMTLLSPKVKVYFGEANG